MRRIPKGRKLLVATVGVAAVSYACSTKGPPETAGNLMAVPEPPDAGTVGPPPAPSEPPQMTGNLMPPPPPPQQDAGGPVKKVQ